MRLKKLTLKNFRNHASTSLLFGDAKFIIVRGANRSGKSSIAQGLSIALAETTMGLAIDGKGYQSKIKDGEKLGTIVAEIQGQLHLYEKTVTLSLGAGGRCQSVKCLDAPDDNKIATSFENVLSRYQDALRIALNTDCFVRMGEKEQKSLLAKLVLPSRYEFPKDTQAAVHEAIGASQIDFDGEPFAVIERAYKLLYKERENVNRVVKEFVIPEALSIPKGVDSESLQKDIAKIKEERKQLNAERDAAVAKANEIEIERGKLQTRLDTLRTEMQKGRTKLAVLDTCIHAEEKMEAYKAIVAKADELAALQKQHGALLGAMEAIDEQIDRLKGIADQGATCPTCDQSIDSVKITALIADLSKEIVGADAKLQELDTKIEAIGNIEAAKANLRTHEQAVKDKAELTASLKVTAASGMDTKAALEALGEKKDATAPFQNHLTVLQTKEDNIIAQLTPVSTAEQRALEIAKKKEQFTKLEAKAKTLDELTKYFDKGGIKAQLIADHIGSFEAKLNSVLSVWGYKAALSSDLSNFDVTTPRGYVGPVKELSGAEEHIFKCAFQCAVSAAAGIKLAVIDEIEELGEDIRDNLYQVTYKLIREKVLDQAIMIGYSLDKTVPEKKAPGSKYLYVTDGEVEVLG